ncbi:MAG: protein translocase subunit SecF [Alphaproteobacteria bacterium]|nr:protein translocase subunit SecF [Alphaproteobacteria bacterium]
MARFNWAFENPHFDFVGRRWIAFTVDGLLLVVALTSLWFQGLNFGIDFTGGVLMEVQNSKEIDTNELESLRTKITNLGFGHVELQTLADASGKQTEALIRVQPSEKLTNQEQVAAQKITAALGSSYKVLRTEAVGPKVSGELFNTGVFAAVLAVLMIAIYVAFRFEWQFGISALLSNGHDVLMAVGLYSVARLDFNLTSIAALLTLAGYSINETVIIFDRIRENRRKFRKTPLGELINMSTNQTLARTVKTSTTVALALIPLALWGGHTLFGFAVTILWGILSGTYSSIFVASSLLLYMPPLQMSAPTKTEARAPSP